jgi:endonuclease/exonuclease/phosphatase family metal-dependent hydrolase
MRSLALAVSLLWACGPSTARTGGSSADPAAVVRVASWNVHDLFDEVADPGTLDPAVPPAEVESRLDAVATVLRRLDADVVLLQEVERQQLLLRLASRAGYAEARLLEGNDPRGIDVALLSRWPVTGYRTNAGELGADGRRLWPRDAVVARLALGRLRLVLVGTHLSSRLSDPDGTRRCAQAARLRAVADGAAADDPGALVLAGGDLNDEATAAALQPLFGDGRWVDGAGGAGQETTAAGPTAWTWSDGRRREALDHLAVRGAQEGTLLAGWVADGPDVAAASDHRPVVLDLRWW